MARVYSELARRVYICVDHCVNREPVGRLYSPAGGKSNFGGVLTLLNQVEASLNNSAGPQPTHEMRSFRKRIACKPQRAARRKSEDDEGVNDLAGTPDERTVQMQGENGRQATFVISIRYRQNSTWQGKIQWIEEKKEQSFRSTLEMIKLMDEALSVSQDNPEFDGWNE